MLRLRYFPIRYYIFTLMSAVAWAADANQTMTVYYGDLQLKDLKSLEVVFNPKQVIKRTYQNNKVTFSARTKTFIDVSLNAYFTKINTKFDLKTILEDFKYEYTDDKLPLWSDLAIRAVKSKGKGSKEGPKTIGIDYEGEVKLKSRKGIMIVPYDKDSIPLDYCLDEVMKPYGQAGKSQKQQPKQDSKSEEKKKHEGDPKPEIKKEPTQEPEPKQEKEPQENPKPEVKKEPTQDPKPEEELKPTQDPKPEEKKEPEQEQEPEQENESNNGITTPLIIVGSLLVATAVAAFSKKINSRESREEKSRRKRRFPAKAAG